MVVAIWYGVEQLGADMGDETPAAAPAEQARREAPRGEPASSSRRQPITQRVRDRVNGAMADGARRHAGDR